MRRVEEKKRTRKMELEQILFFGLIILGGAIIGAQVGATGNVLVYEAARTNCTL